MKISIIIPVYNVEKYLVRCIESVLNQTYKNIEVILVDDGSPDECGKICDKYALKDKRIKVIHKKNGGLSDARNAGLKVITGDYIYFVDSDDFIDCDAIKLLQDRARITNADIIIGNFQFIDDKNEITLRKEFDRERIAVKELYESPLKYDYFFGIGYGTNAWNKLYKSDFIKSSNIRFEKNNKIYAEDILFNLKLFIKEPKIELVNKYTYYYQVNNTSISNSYKKCLTERYISLLENFFEYIIDNDMLEGNKDLIGFNTFYAIDNSCLNSYQYNKNKYKVIKEDLKKFCKSQVVNTGLRQLLNYNHLRNLSRKDWKYFSLVFSIIFTMKMLNFATLLLILRYKIKGK